MVGLAYYFIDRGTTFGSWWCNLCYIPRRISRITRINLLYYRQRRVRVQMLAQQNPNAVGESNSSVVKRLFSFGYTSFNG